MPSGSVTLLEATKCGNDMLKRGIVEVLIQESPILEQLSWMTIAGNALAHNVEESLPTVQFRDVNNTYSRSWGTDTQHFWGVAIMGGEIFVDNFLVDVVGNVTDIKARQFNKIAKSNAMTFDYYALNGTGTASDFKGVKQLIAEGFGQTMNVSGSTAGAALTLDAMDQAMDLLRVGSPDAIWANRFSRRKVTGLARSTYTGVSLIDIGTDVFGRQVTMYNGVPIRILGDDHTQTGTNLLPFTEDPGSGTSTSASMYFVRFGEDLVSGLLGKGGSMTVKDFGETQAAPGHLGRLEWYPGLAIFNKYAIVRLGGILQS